jgi:hypothetical protein
VINDEYCGFKCNLCFRRPFSQIALDYAEDQLKNCTWRVMDWVKAATMSTASDEIMLTSLAPKLTSWHSKTKAQCSNLQHVKLLEKLQKPLLEKLQKPLLVRLMKAKLIISNDVINHVSPEVCVLLSHCMAVRAELLSVTWWQKACLRLSLGSSDGCHNMYQYVVMTASPCVVVRLWF